MYYLLKLEVNYVIKAGTLVVKPVNKIPDGIRFLNFDIDENSIEVNTPGYFWNGERFFESIEDFYNVRDTVSHDIYDITYHAFTIGDDYHLLDELSVEFEDLFTDILLKDWIDFSKPIVFLMSIESEKTWTDCGYEYDTIHECICVLKEGGLEKLLVKQEKIK